MDICHLCSNSGTRRLERCFSRLPYHLDYLSNNFADWNIYAVIAAVNKFAGTSSATGIIVGAFMMAVAFIGNLLISFYNLGIDVFIELWNFIAIFVEFFANVFDDPIGSVIRLFSGMADSIFGVLEGIASAMDTIFGSHLADSVSGWRKIYRK